MLCEKYKFDKNGKFLEPCVGNGNLASCLKELYGNEIDITCVDLIDRNYENTIVQDFLTWNTTEKFDSIITNPPFSTAQSFIEKSVNLLKENGKLAMFLKIQFLESAARKTFFEKYPPKYIYVFSNRMATWNNGQEFNLETGKKWCTTFCHAWFVWEKGSMSEPIIRWL